MCTKTYAFPLLLEKHKERHLKEAEKIEKIAKIHECKTCKKTFHNERNLNTHIDAIHLILTILYF